MENAKDWGDTQRIISLTVILSFIGVVLLWMFFPPKGDPGAIAVLNTLAGALMAGFGTILTFFFGSSKGSSDKDATISKIATSTGNGTAEVITTAPAKEGSVDTITTVTKEKKDE